MLSLIEVAVAECPADEVLQLQRRLLLACVSVWFEITGARSLLGAVRSRSILHADSAERVSHRYNAFGESDTTISHCTRIYAFRFEGEDHEIVLRESVASVSGGQPLGSACARSSTHVHSGTTGLRTWQASCKMANHLLCNSCKLAVYPCTRSSNARIDIVRDQEVLELGAGTGLVSLVAGKIGSRKTIATDFDDRLLDRLHAAIRNSACCRSSC